MAQKVTVLRIEEQEWVKEIIKTLDDISTKLWEQGADSLVEKISEAKTNIRTASVRQSSRHLEIPNDGLLIISPKKGSYRWNEINAAGIRDAVQKHSQCNVAVFKEYVQIMKAENGDHLMVGDEDRLPTIFKLGLAED